MFSDILRFVKKSCLLIISGVLLTAYSASAAMLLPASLKDVSEAFEGYNRVLSQDDLPQLEKLFENHRDFLRKFMEHYSSFHEPTILYVPDVPYEKMGLTEYVSVPYPSYNTLRDGAYQASAMGDYYRLTGKTDKAGEVYLAVYALGIDVGYAFGSTKMLLNHMISVSIQKVALKRLTVLMASDNLSRREAKLILNRLKTLHKMRSHISESFLGERQMVDKTDFRKLAEEGGEYQPEEETNLILRWSSKLFPDRATQHLHRIGGKIYDNFDKASVNDYWVGRKYMEKAQSMQDEILDQTQSLIGAIFSPARTLAYVMLSIMIPNASKALEQDLVCEAYFRALHIINRLHLHKEEHSTFPSGLEVIGVDSESSIMRDPYNGKLMSYRTTENGESYILYCSYGDSVNNNGDAEKDLILYPVR